MNYTFIIKNIIVGSCLAIDATIISLSNAVKIPNLKTIKIILISFIFGLFQFIMPLVGYLLSFKLSNILQSITPFISLFVILSIGINMIKQKKSLQKEDTCNINFISILLQAILTSLDSITIGLTFTSLTTKNILISVFIISITTFIFSLLGMLLGKNFHNFIENIEQKYIGIFLILISMTLFINHFVT